MHSELLLSHCACHPLWPRLPTVLLGEDLEGMDGSPPTSSSNVHMFTHAVAYKLVHLCRRLLASPNQEVEDVLFYQ